MSLFNLQVHTFYRSCNGKASCNCAVAVKSGDDVILLDKCGPSADSTKQPLSVDIYYNGDITSGTKIFRFLEGKRYEVHLPQGTVVKVIVAGEFLNVWVQASAADFNNTQGTQLFLRFFPLSDVFL